MQIQFNVVANMGQGMETNSDRTRPEWATIFDEIREKESLTSDAKLAESLGVTRGYISSVRKGRKGVSLKLAKLIFSRLDKTFETETLERLFIPKKVRLRTENLGALRSLVISRASGLCQLCGNPAPFNSPGGEPYLEIHHVIPSRDGGEDSPKNLVALCPNCHRKINLAPTDTDLETLKSNIKSY